MIPPGFIQDLLARTDIVDVISTHVELKRGGANLMGLCPFHGEKSPSFIVSPSRQTYHCFGCGVHGDAIRFLVEHVGLAFPEAVRARAPPPPGATRPLSTREPATPATPVTLPPKASAPPATALPQGPRGPRR